MERERDERREERHAAFGYSGNGPVSLIKTFNERHIIDYL